MGAKDILIARQGVADQHGVVPGVVQRSPCLVGDAHRPQLLTGLEPDSRASGQFGAWSGKVVLDFVNGFESLCHVELIPPCNQVP